jgi:2-polyprenyl-6-hydroxyphenyl methylase/3-demethylubiquinone-9 3-methyltransferase
VCGVDLEENGVRIARGACPDGLFEVASVYDDLAGLFGHPFDMVVSLEVIEHLFDPRLFLKSVYHDLVPGGLLVLSTPYHGYLKNLAIALCGKFDQHFSPLWDGGHIKFWSRRTLSTVLEECGFSVVDFAGAGRLSCLWKSMVVSARREP